MWTTDRNHTMCTDFYLLQQNAFCFWPSWLSTVWMSIKSPASSLTLRRVWQKLRNGAPAQAGLQRVHPNTIIPLASAIPAARASLRSASNPTSKGHTHGRWRAGKEEMYIFGLGAAFLIAETHATWNGALSTAVTSTIYCHEGLTANLTACCSQTRQYFSPHLPFSQNLCTNLMCGKSQCNKKRPNNMLVLLSTYLSRALSLLRCWKKEGSQMSWFSWQTCLQDFPGSAVFTWRALNGGHITCPWQKSCSDRSYFIMMHPVPWQQFSPLVK